MTLHSEDVVDHCRRVLETAEVTQQDRILVALSGGADSVALAAAVSNVHPRRVCLAYVNHRLQPPIARIHERHVVHRLAQQLRLPLWSRTVVGNQIRKLASRRGVGLEAAARTIRYGLLQQAMVEMSARVLVTGHHRDDELETRLMRLLSGHVITAGSPIQRVQELKGFGKDSILVRPLLDVSHHSLVQFCADRGLRFHGDPSNRDRRYRRNLVRREILPVLKDTMPDVGYHLTAMSEELDQIRQGLEAVAARSIQWHKDKVGVHTSSAAFWGEPPIVRKVAVRIAFNTLGVTGPGPSFRALKPLLTETPPNHPIRKEVAGIHVHADGDTIRIARQVVPILNCGYLFRAAGDLHISVDRTMPSVVMTTRVASENSVRFSGLAPPVIVRNFRMGDARMSDGRRVDSLLQAISGDFRKLVPVVEDRSGIVAVVGKQFGGATIVVPREKRTGSFSFSFSCDTNY